jgi:sarcosine oxidase, subunit alpha
MSKRLPPRAGEWLKRDKPISFYFEGQKYQAYEGDTISSALWAAGEQVLGRSFKYHRPRGVLSLANHDVNVMLADGTDTNMRGDVLPVQDGMQLSVVNTDGGVKKDKKRFIDAISSILPVGFYYKAFHTPRSLFPFWENIIRKSAGLGVVNFNYPRELKRKLHTHCDLLIIGAGPTGLTAALMAAPHGVNILVVDENAEAGGSLSYDHAGSDEAAKRLADLLAELAKYPNVTIRTSAYAAGYYTDHLIPIVETTGITKVRAKAVIVASGAFEQPPVFRNNDLPGVMLATAAQRLLARYATKPYESAVVFAANKQGYRAAMDLLDAGVSVKAIVDLRADGEPCSLVSAIKSRGVAIYNGACVYEVLPAANKFGVKGVVICSYDEASAKPLLHDRFTLECDGVVMSAGWAPAAALLYQAGTGMRYEKSAEQFVPAKLPVGMFAAGKVNGIFDLAQRLQDGARAASEALTYLGKQVPSVTVDREYVGSPSHSYPMVEHPKGKNFVDFDEDISIKDFVHAAQEGFDNIELMKRFTTVGMGPSQGKHSNMNAIRILARIRQLPVERIGTTTARPFFHPTPIGHLAGRGLHPHRLTTLHGWHEAHGAEFTDVGVWKRPAWYRRAGLEKQQAIYEEALAVRKAAGMIDVGTLGKLEVRGPDAAEFLERFYTGAFKSQKIGRTRYALLLDEAGVMVDDGIACRIAEDYFYITASTTNAAAVYREMQRWLQIWQLDVGLVNVTGAYGGINLAGPAARGILSKLTLRPLDDASLPFGAVCDTEIAGVPTRLIRVGFVSDLAFEMHVSAGSAQHVWNALLEHGAADGLRPFGTDTQRLLRLEMGNHLIGQDTDGLSQPFEAGSEGAIQFDKPFFIGQRSLQIISRKPLNKRLVPFTLSEGYQGETINECNLVIGADGNIKGRVTSIAFSPSAGRHIGFAYVDPANTAEGAAFNIRTDSGSLVMARVAAKPFVQLQSEA